MKVAIVGGGFAGLTAALKLVHKGVEVYLYEEGRVVGGLASGFKIPGWQWPVERFYHHIFTSDRAIRKLADRTGYKYFIVRPITSIYFKQKVYPFDSPLSILKFPHLGIVDKIRMGIGLGLLKILPGWRFLENYQADKLLGRILGKKGYEIIWKPLLRAKFGDWYQEVNAAWFWARIKKRTPSLGYFTGGFQGFAEHLQKKITESGGRVFLNSAVTRVEKQDNYLVLTCGRKKERFDKILITTGNSLFLKIVNGLPAAERKRLKDLKALNALVVVLVAKKPLMKSTYWLNIADGDLPFVIVAEHTKIVEPSHYGGQQIIYLGSYLTPKSEMYNYSDSKIYEMAVRQASKINPGFEKKDIIKYFVFREKEAQPLVKINHLKSVPGLKTGIENLYLANMSSIYPWDRGTNYAVELGEKAAKELLSE